MKTPPLRRLVLGLNGATVLLVLGGIVLLVLPGPVPGGSGLPVVVASAGTVPDGGASAPPADQGASERVVRTNIFSARRSPPPRRYLFGETVDGSAELAAEPSMTRELTGEMTDSTAASTVNDPVPHLYGTVLGPAEATALVRLDTRVSEPAIYRVGDRAGGYRVVEIGDRSVTLMGPNGRVVLRLARPAQ
jgi:hypothetical protein